MTCPGQQPSAGSVSASNNAAGYTPPKVYVRRILAAIESLELPADGRITHGEIHGTVTFEYPGDLAAFDVWAYPDTDETLSMSAGELRMLFLVQFEMLLPLGESEEDTYSTDGGGSSPEANICRQ